MTPAEYRAKIATLFDLERDWNLRFQRDVIVLTRQSSRRPSRQDRCSITLAKILQLSQLLGTDRISVHYDASTDDWSEVTGGEDSELYIFVAVEGVG